MARIVSIPPASNVEMDALIAAQAGDSFAVSDNIGITGRVLWRLIGAAFEPHRNLATMNAVAASAVAMNAVAASAVAMDAVAASAVAMNAIWASSTAWNIVRDSNMAVGKFVAGRAGQNATSFADMNTVAASATAMNAVAASATAMNAVAASATAMNAVTASATAVNAVAASATANNIALGSSFSVGAYLDRIRIIGGATTDATLAAQATMNAVAASATAMNAVAASATAVSSVFSSATARIAVYDSNVAWDALRISAVAQTHMISIGLLHSASWESGAPWTHPPSVASSTRVVNVQFRATVAGHMAQSRNFAQTVFFDTSLATMQNVFLRMTGVQHRSATSTTEMRYIIMQ